MNRFKKPTSHFLRLSLVVSLVFASFGAVGPQGCGGEESADVYYYEESEPVYDDVNYEGDWILRNVESEEEEDAADDAGASQESGKNSTSDNDLIEA